jgi:4-hydroxy-2-oxoglutarate aldolase
MMNNLHGVLLPFPTPFKSDGSVDLPGVSANIEKWNRTGISGYVALGSTGERVHLEESECTAVVETARKSVPDDMPFIVGAGQPSTDGTISEIRRRVEAGADAVLVITPSYYKTAMTQDTLFDYYNAVADRSNVPVLLYNIPQLTGIAIAPETVARLSEHGNIMGIKDSSSDFINLGEMLRLAPDDFVVLTGNGSLFYAALSAGARGGILAVGCVAPRLAFQIYLALNEGDHETASYLQRRLTPVARAVTVRYGIGGIKAALDLLGYAGGAVRAPLRSPGEEAKAAIARTIEEAGMLDES